MTAENDQPSGAELCMACRGTGKVISNLGGEARLVDCPWCDGGEVRLVEHDAQARWRDAADDDGEPAA